MFRKIKIFILDIINFFVFSHQMKKLSNESTEFNSLGLKVNSIGNVVYFQLNCTDNELVENNYSPIDMVMNKIKNHIDYMNELGWGEYLIPQITNFVDDKGNQTLSYLILFIYSPILFTFRKLFYFILGTGGIVGIYFIIKWLIETYM